ncbi:MAG: hypothetical protein HC905_19290 [Bacteroidales bacterium]|nr:hypothetical protein [Bacteroidales bacterium]
MQGFQPFGRGIFRIGSEMESRDSTGLDDMIEDFNYRRAIDWKAFCAGFIFTMANPNSCTQIFTSFMALFTPSDLGSVHPAGIKR